MNTSKFVPQTLQENVLKSRCWITYHTDQIVSNVLQHVSRAEPTSMISTIIFPECGSGYNEWNVILALIQSGYVIKEVIFMDSKIETICVDEWYRLALVNQIQMQIFDSYIALERWTQRRVLHHKVIVIYINGGIKFGISHCGCIAHTELRPPACLVSAVKFWDWCDKNVTNQLVNFLGRDMMYPGNCKSWSELACRFAEQ